MILCIKYHQLYTDLYADDTLIYRNIHSEADVSVLQSDLNTVLKWAEDWQMTFNPQKTEFLRITNKHNSISSSYYFKDISIPLSDHVKYLGVIIDKTLNWSQHINMIVAKVNSTRSFLQHNLTKFPPTVKSSCYSILVCPIIEYACTVWSPYHQQNVLKLEMVQWRAARFVTNNYNRTASVTECYISSNGILWRPDEITSVLYYCIKLLTNWWTSFQRNNYCLQTVLQEATP